MITVFGSLNVDLVMKVDHLPQPGETILCPIYEAVAGGKGANQAVAAARAGAHVRMIGCVGQDGFATVALADLRNAGVDVSMVHAVAKPTACAAVMVDEHGENSIVVASGANLSAKATQIPSVDLGPDDLLVLQMEVPHDENWIAIEAAHRAGAKIILSVAPAAPVPSEILNIVDYILVNEIEARMIAEASTDGGHDLYGLPRTLSKRHGFICAMTLGSEGVIAAQGDEVWKIPALPIDNVIDTTGAGDAFAGCLAAALSRNMAIDAALRYASVGAGLSCSVLGAQPSFPMAEEISSALP